MIIMVVDPDRKNSTELADMLQKLYPQSEVIVFRDPLLSLKYGGNNPVDVVFAEAEMRRADGFTLFDALRKFHPDIRTVITANDNSYKEKALAFDVSAYLKRPISEEDVQKASGI